MYPALPFWNETVVKTAADDELHVHAANKNVLASDR